MSVTPNLPATQLPPSGLPDATPPTVVDAKSTSASEPQSSFTMRAFHGPLPDPESLREYELTLPGAADRIITMAETRLSHRNDCEKQEVVSLVTDRKAERTERRLGQWLGFVLVILIVTVAFTAAMYGHEWFASILGGTTVVSIASAFVLGRFLPATKGNGDAATKGKEPSG